MNFFRSEEHLNNWIHYDPNSADQVTQTLEEFMERFSNPRFKERGRSDYISWKQSL